MTDYADSTLVIDLQAIANNYNILARQASGSICSSVVKANAYGLGVERVAPILAGQGCDDFFVANLDEAIVLRGCLPGANIYVFHGVHQGQEKIFSEHRLTPVLNTVEQINRWLACCDTTAAGKMVIHVDTGMNRLGISLEDAELYQHHHIDLVMSHLACADDPMHPLNTEQKESFAKIKQLFPNAKSSLANSYGVFLEADYHGDMVRPGCALYGVNPTPGRPNPMKPVVSLHSRILQIREIDTPLTVGYGATCSLPKGAKVATLPVGYGDGYFRSLGNVGRGVFNGKYDLPIVGRVSMDLTVVDVSNVPANDISEGDQVELLGQNITVDHLAADASTIGYEVLTDLGIRYRREYK